jgi:tetratricopeptide (TPR) repeat protein
MTQAIRLDPDYADAYFYQGMAHYNLGEYEQARSSCEAKQQGHDLNDWCLAMAFEKLGRHADAQAHLDTLQASLGDAAAYQYANGVIRSTPSAGSTPRCACEIRDWRTSRSIR